MEGDRQVQQMREHVEDDVVESGEIDDDNSGKTVKSDGTAPHSNGEDTNPTENVSKRQKKRLAKREKWLANKPIRRAKEKERRKLNEAKRKLELAEEIAKRRKLEDAEEEEEKVKKRPRMMKKMSESSCRTRVAVDIAYDHLMDESEISKTCKQIQRCYAANRRIENPLQFYITNFAHASMEKLVKLGCLKWDVHREPRSHLECFDKTEIVYLTSDSPNVLMNLEESKVYVIGGLVDHNKHKRLCLSLAEKNGVGHARLPIDEFVSMKSTKVLTVFHVYEILVNVTRGMSWSSALVETLPKRKLAEGNEDVEDEEPKDSNEIELH